MISESPNESMDPTQPNDRLCHGTEGHMPPTRPPHMAPEDPANGRVLIKLRVIKWSIAIAPTKGPRTPLNDTSCRQKIHSCRLRKGP